MEHELNLAVLDRLGKRVIENLATCGNCAQTTFLTLQEEFKLDGDEILKALTPFPGIALRGETCGAVTGSLMVIGLIYGRDRENLCNWQAYINSLPPSRKFCHLFEAEMGSTMCAEIVESQFGRKFNLAKTEEALQWLNCGALEKCGAVIAKSVKITANIIMESGLTSQ
jgi:C_GCAxxG_C_C family probable redox protein